MLMPDINNFEYTPIAIVRSPAFAVGATRTIRRKRQQQDELDANGGVPLPKKKKPRVKKTKTQAVKQGSGTITTEQALLFEALDVLSGVSKLSGVSEFSPFPNAPKSSDVNHSKVTNITKVKVSAPNDEGSSGNLQRTPPSTASKAKPLPQG